MESIVSGEQQLSDREHRTESSSKTMTFQKMTPPESPDFSHALPAGVSTTLTSIADGNVDLEAAQNVQQGSEKSKMGSTLHERKKKPHHFAIITSPFLRCSQTAIEMAIGMRNSASGVDSTQQPHQHDESDVVTIAVETGLSGK
ncbi:hypothetical protein FBU30_008955 [Linnemannia zychae]|nr:hypothetical protein FBU30_008955 [Linnemannia zychae]